MNTVHNFTSPSRSGLHLPTVTLEGLSFASDRTEMNKPDLPYIPDYLDQRLIALGLTPGQRLVADRVLRWTTWDTDAEEYVVHWPVTLKAAARLGVNKKLLTRTKEALSAKEEITQMSGANRAAGESEVWVVTKLIHEKKERN